LNGQRNGILQPGVEVTFDGFDPSGRFAHVHAVLPNGQSAEGFILNQNLTTVQPALTHFDVAPAPVSPQSFASSGQATKA
jgi:hypothetical protein